MNYDIQKLILSFVSHNTLPTIVNNPTLFDVVVEDKYWKREASKYSIKKTPLGIIIVNLNLNYVKSVIKMVNLILITFYVQIVKNQINILLYL